MVSLRAISLAEQKKDLCSLECGRELPRNSKYRICNHCTERAKRVFKRKAGRKLKGPTAFQMFVKFLGAHLRYPAFAVRKKYKHFADKDYLQPPIDRPRAARDGKTPIPFAAPERDLALLPERGSLLQAGEAEGFPMGGIADDEIPIE